MKDAIKTKVDKVVEYVYACGEIPATNVAETVGVPLEQVEEWAKPLEDSEFIRVKYSPMHGMILISKPISEKEMGVKLDQFKLRKDDFRKDAQKMEAVFLKYSEDLPELEYNLKEIEKRYNLKAKAAKSQKSKKDMVKLLADLREMHAKLEAYEREMSGLQAEKKDTGKIIDEFKKDTMNLEKRAKLASKTMALGKFYDFLSKAEKDAIEAKKREERFVSGAETLRKRLNLLMPQVELTYKEHHKKDPLDFLKSLWLRK